jgi:transcription elongation GreA/GreB family factor
MTFFNFFPLATASTPLLNHKTARNFWPISPLLLAAMLEQLESPNHRRTRLQISGIQPGCSVLLCNENQQVEWCTLATKESPRHHSNEVALLSPLGLALIGKNVGDVVTIKMGRHYRCWSISEIIRVQLQPGQKSTS